jgi:hypothetical protein
VPNLLKKLYAPEKNFEVPQYRLHTDFSKEAYAENLANIASELSILEPICYKNRTPLKFFLSCLNIGFILNFLKKLMLKI